jgi:hypothetical protein
MERDENLIAMSSVRRGQAIPSPPIVVRMKKHRSQKLVSRDTGSNVVTCELTVDIDAPPARPLVR